MYNAIYLHKVARGADLHLAYAMYLAAKRNPKSIFGNLLKNPNMELILSLTDDILIDKLREIDDGKVKQIVDDFLSRKILTMVKEYDHVPKTIVNTGIPELSKMIKTRAGLDEDMPVIIDLPAVSLSISYIKFSFRDTNKK